MKINILYQNILFHIFVYKLLVMKRYIHAYLFLLELLLNKY